MSEVGTAEHGDPVGMTPDAWGQLLPQPLPCTAGKGGVGATASPVEMPRLPEAPGWTPEQQTAFRRFHRQFAEKFLLYAEGKLPNRCDAEDAVNSTFEVVVRI
ncbi:hypothetical protein ACFV9E_23125 [Streptomyces sp. NPDC059835]|uniref:hypothetical protein n=1 Tax=Streptomyces sp. NPDC059835 TaxID=3346967 RepID=UPI003668572F